MDKKKPLEGVKIVDFCWALVGPITTKFFSDYGAEVVKIEGGIKVGKLDSRRTDGFYKGGIPGGVNCSSLFNVPNTGKLSVTLDLAHPKGLNVAKRFVAWADIVAENFAGGVMNNLGLGYEELRKIKPDIIMMSSCMMGQTGPQAWLGGVGPLLTALSGMNHLVGLPDRDPVLMGPYTDFVAPTFNIVAILAALEYRRQTGKGQYLDMSQYENGLHFMAPLLLDYTVNRRVSGRIGNYSSYAVPHNAYPCRGKDKWCVIAVFNDEQWIAFCKVIGHPPWTKDAKFSTFLARKENEVELDKNVQRWTQNFTAEDIMNRMQSAGVAAGVVQTGEDLLENDPQIKHRALYSNVKHPEVGCYKSPRSAFLLSDSDYEVRRAPLLGEHNEYALKEILGMSDDEIADLVASGVIE